MQSGRAACVQMEAVIDSSQHDNVNKYILSG